MNDQLHDIQQNSAYFELQRWLQDGLLTWTWWFMLAMFILPWCIFLWLVDRKRAPSIWLFGLVVIIISSFIDDLGAELGYWIYPIKLVPFSLIAFPFDFSPIPVAQMLIFQYFTTWRSFSIALFLQAILFSFIGEPFSIWAGAVDYYGWNYFHSFLFYMIAGTISRAFVMYWISKSAN
jgi:hypothetical protein